MGWSGLLPASGKLARGAQTKSKVMPATTAQNAIAVVRIDIGENSFHITALDDVLFWIQKLPCT